MSKVSTHLYTLAAFNFFMATMTIANPFCIFQYPPGPQLAELTGLKLPTPSRTHEIAIGLKMYILALLYFWGARNQVKAIRTGAFIGMIVYADGSFLTCLLAPHLDGGVVLLETGALYVAICAWMMLEKGMLQEAKEFVVRLVTCEEHTGKKE
ncbi:hypothetical protein BDD12DRAFT_858325 [Trichophaea hybrida]|nr:hypothetical protein BDD12DRAFT_858325 [Trichophaea hybrida]